MDNEYDADYYIFEEDFTEEGVNICERYKKRSHGRIFNGRNRNVFVLGTNIVVKIPTCLDGITDNEWEGSVSNANDDPEEIRWARLVLIEKISAIGEMADILGGTGFSRIQINAGTYPIPGLVRMREMSQLPIVIQTRGNEFSKIIDENGLEVTGIYPLHLWW